MSEAVIDAVGRSAKTTTKLVAISLVTDGPDTTEGIADRLGLSLGAVNAASKKLEVEGHIKREKETEYAGRGRPPLVLRPRFDAEVDQEYDDLTTRQKREAIVRALAFKHYLKDVSTVTSKQIAERTPMSPQGASAILQNLEDEGRVERADDTSYPHRWRLTGAERHTPFYPGEAEDIRS